MYKYSVTLFLATSSTAAFAQEVELKPIIDMRIRYEHVDQDNLADDADALTTRLRAGVEAKSGAFSVLVEGEGTLALVEKYNSGLNGLSSRPIVGDPQNVELNRAQLQFRGVPGTVVTLGRQRINLDDQRFVGAVGWRQNEQTFDAARVEWSPVKSVKLDVTYAWSDRTIWGVDGSGARQQAVSGDNVFANLGFKQDGFALTGFAYLVDQDEAAVQYYQLSNQTYGVRGSASVPLGGTATLALAASYARQSDYHNNPNDYDADYWFAEAALGSGPFKLTGGYEVLGAAGGTALTSFQTPLATLHKFNGAADKFLTTPANGLRDLYVGASFAPSKCGINGLNAGVTWHRFTSDRLSLDYGDEWDAHIGFKPTKKIAVSTKYARYDTKGGGDFSGDVDTSKFWLQLDYAY